MNTNHDELERLLGAELSDRAGDMTGARLRFDDVRGHATSIRRRRRVATGVGVAAALAIIVPAAITVGGSIDGTTKPDPAPPPPAPAQTTLTLDGVPRGDEPQIEYFTADGVVVPGEGLLPLDQSYQAFVPSDISGGWVALSPSRDELVDINADLQPVESRMINQTMVSNPDRTAIAFTAPESGGQTLFWQSTVNPDFGPSWDFPASPLVEPVDFVGEDRIVYETTDARGRHQSIGIANGDGTTTEFEGDFVHAVSASPETGLVAVQTRSNDDASGCFGVVDPAESTADTIWETCDYSLGAMSPDGRYIIASLPYLSGLGVSSVSVLEAETGDLVATFEQPRNGQLALISPQWESSDSFIAVATQGTTNTLLRFGVDGTLEETIDRIPGDPLTDLPVYLGDDRQRGF
jgi:hypothetical protein